MPMKAPYFRKSDRKSVVALIVMALAGIILFYYSGTDTVADASSAAFTSDSTSASGTSNVKKPRFHRSSLQSYRAGTRPDDARYASAQQPYSVDERQHELFPFDPNTADSTALLRLGLQPWQVRNIYKYRASGGIYRRAADFARLYGLTVGQYRRLEPYIRISPDYLPAASLPEAALPQRDTLLYPVKLREGEHVVLNRADTSLLKRVPGIGRGFARMIADYGERLGGYVSVDQLDEIDDFPQSAKAYFVIDKPVTRRINLNRLTVLQMRRHPYITFHQARTIDDYRRMYGPLRSLHDLSLHSDFPPEAISRLEPYVEF